MSPQAVALFGLETWCRRRCLRCNQARGRHRCCERRGDEYTFVHCRNPPRVGWTTGRRAFGTPWQAKRACFFKFARKRRKVTAGTRNGERRPGQPPRSEPLDKELTSC